MDELAVARARMRTARGNYVWCCREYAARVAAWNERYAARPLVAKSRRANDAVLWEIAADIAMYRADTAMWAEVVAALRAERVRQPAVTR
jgi:hypothetical protein